MIGTYDYMPPEQMVGGDCTAQSDVFTLGVVMYEMIAGHKPFGDHDTPTAMLAALLATQPAPLGATAEVPPELDRIVRRCLGKKPEQRYPSVDELARDLEILLAVEDDRTRAGSTSSTELMDAVTRPVPEDVLITPQASADDVPIDTAFTPKSSLDDVPVEDRRNPGPEDAATQFTPPPVFEDPAGDTTTPREPIGKPKFVRAGTLPGIIAPKKKP
jgi:serine/threonine protein kinase